MSDCFSLDCSALDEYQIYALDREIFPFVNNCPPGFPCQNGVPINFPSPGPGPNPTPGDPYTISMVCCGQTLTAVIPAGATLGDFLQIENQLVTQCVILTLGCPTGDGTPTRIFFNTPQTCTAHCPVGTDSTATVPLGTYMAASQSAANKAAHDRACELAQAKCPKRVPTPPRLTVDAYWTFDNFAVVSGELTQTDEVHGIVLTNNSTWFGDPLHPPIDNVPGLIGDGLGYRQAGSSSGMASPNIEPRLQLQTSNGWSVFFWFRVLNWAASYSQYPQINWRFGNVSDFYVQFGDFPTVHAVLFSLHDDNGTLYTPANFPVILGAWYFCHLFYDPVSKKVGYQINNGSPVFASGPDPLFTPMTGAGFLDFFEFWPAADTTNYGPIVDEFGMKLSRKLTSAELAFLYNGGTGRTWPLT